MAGKREQQMKEITERLEQGVKELFTSEMYTEYLKTMSQFHNYSFNNTLLIAMQKPDATLVAGYQAWQKKFKRQVKRGEKGIQIIAPAPIREKEEIEKFDPETNEPLLRPDGQPETEEVVHTIPRFRVATVFDVSQTYGEPLPELETPELMGNVENFENFMQALREIAPVPMRFDEIESGAKGYYSNTNKEIVIQSGMSESQTMKTGIHETTHAKLHDREIMEELGEKKNQMTREVEAESVAYTVCQYFGLDTSDYSFPYIAGWSSSVEMKELRASMDTIRKTAGEMIDGMTEVMQRLIREQQEKEALEENVESVENQEKYQEVEFFDVPALFANERVDMANLPQGIYRYELRGADYDSGYPLTVENHVAVNHAATILTVVSIDFQEQGYFRLGDELNFTGGESTIREYQQEMSGRNLIIEREKQENAIGRANEQVYLSGQEERYAIYQIGRVTKGGAYQFMGMDFVNSHDMKVEASDYEYVYGGRLSEGETLDSLYEKFNLHHPEGYEGHSLSVSDVVVLQREGTTKAYYVDSFGFTELPDFVRQRLHEAEMNRKREDSLVTLDTSGIEIEQHEGLWHTVDKREIQNEIFYLMKHNEYGDSVAAVIVSADGELVAQELEKGFAQDAMDAVQEYLLKKGIEWEPGEQELKEWGIEVTPNYPAVYQHTLDYAMEHAATDEYLDSRKLNIDCKRAVEDAIRNHFDGLHLAYDAAETVLEEYGQERLSFVLACSVQYQSSDGRISRDTKEWAESIVIPENISRGIDANLDYVVNSHPGVLDVFIGLARQRFVELEKIQEPEKEGISLTGEQADVLDKIACASGMDSWFSVGEDNTYIYDFENNEKLSLKEGIQTLYEGMTSYRDYDMTSEEISVFEDLLEKMEIEVKYLNSHDTELAYKIEPKKGYLFIQTSSEGGYDYTFYDEDYREVDGGIYDNGDLSVGEVIDELISEQYGMTLPEPKIIDCEQFLDTVDRAEYFPQRSYEALKELMNSGADEIAFRVGYGYVSVQRVPEGYEYIDYDDKWQEIDGDIYDDPDASMEDVVSWIFKKQRFGDLDCAPLDYQEVVKETIQSAEERMSEDKLTPTSQISRKERALGGESRHDIEETVLCYAQAQLEDMGLAGEVRLNSARVYGSRTREGLYNNESDVDVVLSYTGNIREDDFFSTLHKDGMAIAGLSLDINPISTERTGTIQEYLEQAEKYLDQKEVQNLTSDIVKFELDYESDRDMLEFWDGKAEVETEPIYQVYEVIGNAVERKDTEKFVAHLEQIIHEHEVEEPITGAAADLLGKITGKLVIVQPEPKISFYVAECMEFPVMGEYYDNLTLQEAVQKYEEIPADRINGIKGIGFRLEDGSIYDGEYELMSAGVILKDSIDLVPHYKESPLVQQAIIDLEKILSGRQQEKISEQPQVSADKGAAEVVSETASELVKQPERTPEKDNSKSEGTGRKQSVLNALRERQAKLKQEQKSTEQKPQNQKGEQEL